MSSNDNPADLISRGVRPFDLVENRLWWHGPSWLGSSTDRWDTSQNKNFGTKEEERTHIVCFAYFEKFYDLLENFSSYPRALRVMAFVVRGIHGILKIKGLCYKSVDISPDEMKSVKEKLIMVAQKAWFPNEYSKLTNKEMVLAKIREQKF